METEKLVAMSKKEFSRYTAIDRVLEKRIKQREAAELLGVSERHFRRLLKRYREQRAKGLISQKRGKPSNRRLSDKIKKKALRLMKTKYEGFGSKLGKEKLEATEKINTSNGSQNRVSYVLQAKTTWIFTDSRCYLFTDACAKS